MATDRLEPAGVYFGTSGGELFASADEGETWRCIASGGASLGDPPSYQLDQSGA